MPRKSSELRKSIWPHDCFIHQHYSSESKLKRGCNAPDRKKLHPDEGLAIDREAHFLTEVFQEASDWPLVMRKPLHERLSLFSTVPRVRYSL